MNGAELIVSALENEGVQQIFGIPGEENLDVVEALRRSKIELVLTRHEQAAAFMAATHGRLTGKPGVCLTTLGPGALNLTTGAAYALLGAMPMVMITGQKGILSRKQAGFQVVDIVSTMTPLTKMARSDRERRDHSDAWCGRRSASRSRSGRARFISNCRKTSPTRRGRTWLRSRPIRSICRSRPRAALDRAAQLILNAERPLIMLGAAASRPRLADALSEFVQAGADPVLQYADGQGRRHRRARTSTWAPRRCRSATTSIGRSIGRI